MRPGEDHQKDVREYSQRMLSSLFPSRPSFREAIRRAEEQAEYPDCYTAQEEYMAHELCKIIAEVYLMDPKKPIRISGEWLDGHVVAEVFGEITHKHITCVMEEYERQTDEIRNVKAYLRTMLYNSVFTVNSHIGNRLNHHLNSRAD
ncbi:MAG: hypothetical protein IJ459_01910 [Clostridia bacterium]|nr:hypothetical protein [Clostridia bacterium]